jgi:subtilisin family serine protease
VFALLNKLTGVDSDRAREESTTQYVFANLRWDQIEELVKLDTKAAEEDRQRANSPDEKPDAFRAIFRIWPNFEIRPCLMDSLTTVKADAAQISFTALGQSITWAVIDSGIHSRHPHFHLHGNVNPRSPLHRDFTLNANNVSDPNNAEVLSSALIDGFGHGTHVAGIIAGEHDGDHPSAGKKDLQGFRRQRSEREVEAVELQIRRIRGVAPKCSLVSLKVLDDRGYGDVGNVIRALTYVLKVNGNGSEEQVIHGVNISLGYDFDPEWFACGESPVCNEVNRLVRSGVVVVVAAGNTGYGYFQSLNRTTKAGLGVTINDPGNAELAVTVGSTHRKMPHRYGVSYFSSKGPTSDGRAKPDLIAPGEKILSCAQGDLLRKKLEGVSTSPNMEFHYLEESGTSMAAPHVSGVIAAFLSVRQEFIGHPWRLKEIFMSTATDLRRDRYFQGAGLIDLMRAIQSV